MRIKIPSLSPHLVLCPNFLPCTLAHIFFMLRFCPRLLLRIFKYKFPRLIYILPLTLRTHLSLFHVVDEEMDSYKVIQDVLSGLHLLLVVRSHTLATHVAIYLMVKLLPRVVHATLRRIPKCCSFEGIFSLGSLPLVQWRLDRFKECF